VRAGEEVLVEAGEVVPVDGVVAQGEATVVLHPAAKTSVVRRPGDALLAGARVMEGSVRVTATRVGSARALFRPPSFGQELASGSALMVRAVARGKTPWVAALYAGVVVSLALTFGAGFFQACAASGSALLAFPLLALVRGVRLSFVSASALGASRGIVFRDAATLERAGRIGAAALCTDRTVTTGACSLVEVSPLGREHSASELTALAMGAESAVEDHPIARAITRYGQERGIVPAALRRVAYARGRGVTALVEGGGALVLGNRQALLNAGVSVAVADREAQRAEAMGRTVVFLAVGGRVRALFVLEDPVRPEARAAVQTLIDLAVEVVLLAGDHRTTVESLARPLDITHIKAELTSEERAQEVTRLRDAGVVVAVIGHAPDDELAFATSDVALTLDAAGGVHEGDIAVGSDDLRDAADALVLAQRARRNVQGVLALSLGGGVMLAAAAALGLAHPALALALSLAIDAWALPSPARLLRRRKRSFGATRSGVGLMRRA
jgi:P-type E1-E2 ATPase